LEALAAKYGLDVSFTSFVVSGVGPSKNIENNINIPTISFFPGAISSYLRFKITVLPLVI
jgi:hypothetical protein